MNDFCNYIHSLHIELALLISKPIYILADFIFSAVKNGGSGKMAENCIR